MERDDFLAMENGSRVEFLRGSAKLKAMPGVSIRWPDRLVLWAKFRTCPQSTTLCKEAALAATGRCCRPPLRPCRSVSRASRTTAVFRFTNLLSRFDPKASKTVVKQFAGGQGRFSLIIGSRPSRLTRRAGFQPARLAPSRPVGEPVGRVGQDAQPPTARRCKPRPRRSRSYPPRRARRRCNCRPAKWHKLLTHSDQSAANRSP